MATTTTTVKVTGLRELQRSFRQIDKKLVSDLGKELAQFAEPVAGTARDLVSRFEGASLTTIRPRRSGLTIYVEQGARKVTGRRGDFGALQMTTALMPALDEHSDDVLEKVDDLLGRWGREAGF